MVGFKRISFLIMAVVCASCFTGCRQSVSGDSPMKLEKDSLVQVFLITYHVKPEKVTLFKQVFDSCAVKTKQESGCLVYDMYQSYADSTCFFLLEKWKDKAEHNKHMKTEHLLKYIQQVQNFFVEGGEQADILQVCPPEILK